METVICIGIGALLCIGPMAGFIFGMKCCKALLGIETHKSESLRVVDWNDLPEVYRPRPENDAQADDSDAQEAAEGDLQGAEPPDAKVHAEDAVDALLTALDAARVTPEQVIKGTGEFLEAVEAYGGGAAVDINSTETLEITPSPTDGDEV